MAGAHKSGRLSDEVDGYFPFDASKVAVSQREPYTPQQIQTRVARYAEFAATYPQLLPANIRSTKFIARLSVEAPRLTALAPRVRAFIASEPDYIALCHWNANIDNAWFMRTPTGIECGLLDWGHVSQMNVAMALWGCLSGAEVALWNSHLEELLALFAAEFHGAGGRKLNTQQLHTHLVLYAVVMGLNWLLDVPPYIIKQFPDLSNIESRCNTHFRKHEAARTQLQMMTVFLNLWQMQDMGRLVSEIENRTSKVRR